jgi:hypothetical protein
MTRKSCPYCYCTNVTKHGKTHGRQRYECQGCYITWSGLPRDERDKLRLWREYCFEGSSVAVLAKRYSKSSSTIRRFLDSYTEPDWFSRPRSVTIILDVTYFKGFGILVAYDPYAKEIRGYDRVLYYAVLIGTEKTIDYDVATDTIEAMGFTIRAAVIDGRRGVRQMLEHKGIPVQQCQFHQLLTITSCLTKHPILIQNKELRAIALTLTRTTKEHFEYQLDEWHAEHGDWLKERYTDPKTGRHRYQHDRTRRAYFSLRRNLEYLFTYQDENLQDKHGNKLRMPNTTNPLDGQFGVWKRRINKHPGASKQRIITMLRSFFSEGTD